MNQVLEDFGNTRGSGGTEGVERTGDCVAGGAGGAGGAS
jgi:hypothetical protein